MMNTKHSAFTDSHEYNYVVSYFTDISPQLGEDIKAAFLLLEQLIIHDDELQNRVHLAYVMCRYMEPDVEDVIALLLWKYNWKGKAGKNYFAKAFRSNRSDSFYRYTLDAYKDSPYVPEGKRMTFEAAVDFYIYMRVCDKMFKSLVEIMEKNRIPDSYCIYKAYDIARNAHYGVFRKSGEPYLTHPIVVASILAKIGIESHIVAAALLHDVVEDTSVTLKEISNECGERISQYVDAVTSLHKQYAGSHIAAEYSSDKQDLDTKSFEKLVQAVHSDRKMEFALFIKAADRVHNLSTIDVTPSEKQHDKIEETELDYLPLFKEFGLNYFVDWIDDLTWKVTNPVKYEQFNTGYKMLCEYNQSHINSMLAILKEQLGERFNSFCANYNDNVGYEVEIKLRYYRPKEVFRFVRNAVGSKTVSANMIDKKTVATCDFDIILDGKTNESGIDLFATLFVKLFNSTIASSGREIADLEVDNNRFIVKVEDRYKNVFRLCFAMRNDYISYRLGNRRGIFKESVTPTAPEKNSSIIIRLRNGKPMEIPVNATALDLAFIIHPDIGLCAKAVRINDRPARISSILHDGDKVEIDTDTERVDGEVKKFIPHARINWLTFVKTKLAKNKIARYLESQYEGDCSATDVQDEACINSQEKIWENTKASAKGLFANNH